MATRTLAVASAGSGGAGAGACPAAARSRACVSWAATSASLSPPTTSAPRSGALADAGCVTGAGGAVTATDVAPLSPALGFAACRATHDLGCWDVRPGEATLVSGVILAGNVFLDHRVEVGATKTEGTDATAPNATRRHGPIT